MWLIMLGVSDNYVTPLEVVVCVNRVEDSRGGSLGCGSNLEVLLSSYPESNRFIFVVYHIQLLQAAQRPGMCSVRRQDLTSQSPRCKG